MLLRILVFWDVALGAGGLVPDILKNHGIFIVRFKLS